MPNLDQLNASGEGHLDVPVPAAPLYIAWYGLVASPQVQFRSVAVPRRLLHVGWIGIKIGASGGTSDYMTWFKYVEFEREWINLVPLNLFANSICWHIELGCTISIRLAT